MSIRDRAHARLGIFLVFMLCVAFVFSGVQTVKATGVIYIRASGYVDPPTAPISTLDLVTYGFTDSTNCSVVIERSDIIVDGNGYNVTGSGDPAGFSLTGMHNVTIKNTHIKGFQYGIILIDSSSNHLTRNKIAENVWAGILLRSQSGHSNNNSITENCLEHNLCGIKLDAALMDCVDFNEITGNNITSNNVYGIYLDSCFNNRIFHNSFIQNHFQAYSECSVNIWDNGYPSGGNYWSDYLGTDTRHGQYQNETGKDDIGDYPYIVESVLGDNKDNYPLMNRYVDIHDIELIQVIPSETSIRKGKVMNVTVVVENQGKSAENFNITLNANTTLISVKNAYQAASTVENYVFVWNTTDYPPGNYMLTAIADQVPGETDILDNILASSTVQVTFTEFEVVSYLSTVPIGKTLLVNVTIAQVCNLTLWQFKLYFKKSIVECTDVFEGPFLKGGGETTFTSEISNSFNSTHGVVLANCSLLGNSTTTEEGGTLATLSFDTLAEGNATLSLGDTNLQDNQMPPRPISHKTVDSVFLVTFTRLDVAPISSITPMGRILHVDVNVAYVSDLTLCQFDLCFDSSILNCTSAAEGSFMKTFGTTSFIYTINNEPNTTLGFIQMGCFLVEHDARADGSGILATVTFEALVQGNTTLSLNNTGLQDNQPLPQLIPHRTVDGMAYVIEPTHDIAVINLTAYKTVVGKGYLNNLTAIVQNQGFFTETFNITFYADSTVIGTIETTLESWESGEYIIPWNTSLLSYGSYATRAYAWPVAGENDTINNDCIGDFVGILKPGDIKEEFGKIDMKDISYVARRFNIGHANPLWDSKADINSDGKVDMKDIAIAAKNFGTPY